MDDDERIYVQDISETFLCRILLFTRFFFRALEQGVGV
jgi:hypothetical protein